MFLLFFTSQNNGKAGVRSSDQRETDERHTLTGHFRNSVADPDPGFSIFLGP
jgi:hypothetical protein